MFTVKNLLSQGYTPEQADALVKMHNDAVTSRIDGNYVPRATFDAERDKVKDLTEQVSSRDTQIQELSESAGTVEELRTELESAKTANATAQAEYDKKVHDIEVRTAVTLELSDVFYDMEDALNALDLSKISVKDGKVRSGLSEQVEDLKEAKPHWVVKIEDESTTKNPEWQPFGVTPIDGAGKDEDKTPSLAEFGKNLALASQGGKDESPSQQASKYYFNE